MPPPTVAVVGPIPPWRSGIADQNLRLARAMQRLGVTPLIFTYRRMYPPFLYPGISDRGEGEFPEELPEVVPVLDWASIPSFHRAGRHAAERGVPLAIVPWWTAFWAPHTVALLAGLSAGPSPPVRLLLCHNVADHEESRWKKVLAGFVLARADRIVVQNRRAARTLEAERPGTPVACIPHPSEPCAVLPDRPDARARLGVPPEAPLFLFSGILRPYKGWDLLLTAFARVRDDFPEALLVFAGEPWGDAQALAEKVGERGWPGGGRHVRLELRYMSEEERTLWFAACDAVVCPYRHATGSGIAADAIAHGRPVIGTRVDGLLDVIEDGISGLLVPPGDVEALAAAMKRFLSEGLGPRLSAGVVASRPRFLPDEHARRVLAFGGVEV